jgi:hypothetical protein
MKIDTYEALKRRFPILEPVISHLNCSDSDKRLLQELFVAVYSTGYDDGQAAAGIIR